MRPYTQKICWQKFNINIETEKIMQEGREKIYEKIMCKQADGMRRITCCDKLWHKKKNEIKDDSEGEEEEEIGRVWWD